MGNSAAQIKRVTAFAAIYVLWGGSFLAIHLVVSSIPPMFAASVRYSLSGLILIAISVGIRHQHFADFRQIINCCVVGLAMIVAGYSVVFWSSTRLPSWMVAVLVSTSFLWTYLGECLVLRSQRARPAVIILLLVGLAGIPFLSGLDLRQLPLSSIRAMAGILASSLIWSAGTLALKRVQLPACPLQAAGWQLGFAGIVLAAVSFKLGEWGGLTGFNFSASAKPIFGMAYLVLGGSVTAFSAYHWLMRHESPTLVATFSYVNPIIAMLLGIGFAHEHCSLTQLVATSTILASVLLVWRIQASSARAQMQMIEPSMASALASQLTTSPEGTY